MEKNIASIIRNDSHVQNGITKSFRFFIILNIYFMIHSLTTDSFLGYTYLLIIIFPLVGFLTSLVLNRMDFRGEKINIENRILIFLVSSFVSSFMYVGGYFYIANKFEYSVEYIAIDIGLIILLGVIFQSATTSKYISAYNKAVEEFNFFDYIAPGSEDKVYKVNKKIDLLRDNDIEVDPYNIISDLASINKKLNQETAFYFSTTLNNYIPNLEEAIDLVSKATKESDRNVAISLTKDIICRIEEEINFYEDTESQVTEILKEKELEQEEDSFEERITLIKKSLD